MKRSKTASLIVMGTLPLLLSACSPAESSKQGFYTSVDSCASSMGDRGACQQAFDSAQSQAAQDAPRYANREECLAQHPEGDCQQQTRAGHSYFMPMMAGFLIGQMMRGPTPAGLQSAPAFRDNHGGWLQPRPGTAGGSPYNARPSQALAPLAATPDRAPTVQRGGFGGSSRSSAG